MDQYAKVRDARTQLAREPACDPRLGGHTAGDHQSVRCTHESGGTRGTRGTGRWLRTAAPAHTTAARSSRFWLLLSVLRCVECAVLDDLRMSYDPRAVKAPFPFLVERCASCSGCACTVSTLGVNPNVIDIYRIVSLIRQVTGFTR